MKLNPERIVGLAMAVGAIAIVGVLVVAVGAELTRGGSGASSSAAVGSPTVSPSPDATPEPTPTASPTPSPTPAAPSLPTMLAAIGDSYTQAWSVSPAYKKDHPQFSWAVGTATDDGVYSLRERFEALGAKPTVVDAATSGKKMSDASRQASLVIAEVTKLPPGSTVYVTFELGTNDLCDDPMTSPGAFEAQLRAGMGILRSGLPSGSRVLMLSVPDFVHFWEITQADPTAKLALQQPVNSRNCAPFLGKDTHYTFAQSKQMLAAYNTILADVCAEVEASDGPSGRLHCRTDPLRLSEKDFTLADLSTADYFHPSLTGQAKMAEAAWQAGYWATLPLPS